MYHRKENQGYNLLIVATSQYVTLLALAGRINDRIDQTFQLSFWQAEITIEEHTKLHSSEHLQFDGDDKIF